MDSSTALSKNGEKKIRSQAVATVTQEMSSARLKILGDLMESRKKAEAHEQEFLRTIHSENAAFSQIVSLFEGSLSDLKAELTSDSHSLEEQLSTVALEIGSFKESISGSVASHVSKVTELVNGMKQELEFKLMDIHPSIEALRSRVQDSTTLNDKRMGSLRSEVSDIANNLESSVSASVTKLGEKFESLNGAVSASVSRMDELAADTILRVEQLRTEIATKVQERDACVLGILDSKLADLEGSLRTVLNEKTVESAAHVVAVNAETMSARMKTMEDSFLVRLGEIESKLNFEFAQRLEKYEAKIGSLESALAAAQGKQANSSELESLVGAKLEAKLCDYFSSFPNLIETRMAELKGEIDTVALSLTGRLSEQEHLVKSIGSAGYHYDWVIPNALARLASLGPLAGKYISSEPFSVGPFRDLQFRFFPEAGIVWLIHRPTANSSEALLPLAVDIGVGTLKRGPIRMKKVQELFGHWVWEAAFTGLSVSAEVSVDESLRISVEVCARQWLEDLHADPPDSPSQMSSYSFSAPPKTNPFTPDLTPSRSSWAQFGEDEEIGRNPFH